jgi:putative tryptophan/tyrosine transport system substrate-binding protein
MRRLAFIALLVSGAAVAWPPPVSGQQAPMPVVGVLSSQSRDSEAAVLAAWHRALNETGYVGGRNAAIEFLPTAMPSVCLCWRPTWSGDRSRS